ncbi:hypothetical protein HPB49_004105 [Dermacentor silvarum]|uniref:Uncharacterized protein n=1 Tax=Dermacentor silvarum TaxID=543639 RepID=A0ACB8DUE1_DERSI|nr:hypothetical protein HPB49_004105 [Dermacentor silvarum]
MESLPEKVDNIEKSISMMSDKYDEVLNVMSRHDAELKELRKRVEAVESRSDTEEVEVLKRTVNDLEYRSRRQNIVIHGITESQNEDLLCKVNEVAQSVGLPDLLPKELQSAAPVPVGKAEEVQHAEEPRDEPQSLEMTQRARETGAMKRQPANSTILPQILNKQRQLQCSIENRRDRKKMQEKQLQRLLANTNDKLLSVLSEMIQK